MKSHNSFQRAEIRRPDAKDINFLGTFVSSHQVCHEKVTKTFSDFFEISMPQIPTVLLMHAYTLDIFRWRRTVSGVLLSYALIASVTVPKNDAYYSKGTL